MGYMLENESADLYALGLAYAGPTARVRDRQELGPPPTTSSDREMIFVAESRSTCRKTRSMTATASVLIAAVVAEEQRVLALEICLLADRVIVPH